MPNTSISTSGIFGTDGETPSYDPTATFKIWRDTEIFFGGVGLNKHVPKVGDVVMSFPPVIFKEVVVVS